MTNLTIDTTPTTGRSAAAVVTRVPPAIIAAAAALGAYQAAPVLVEYFKLNRPLYADVRDVGAFVQPKPKPILAPAPPPVVEPAHEEIVRPVAPPVVRQQEAPTAPVIVAVPSAATMGATTGAMMRPAIRGRVFRVGPPRLRLVRGFSGFRGMIHLGHVAQMIHFARHFHR